MSVLYVVQLSENKHRKCDCCSETIRRHERRLVVMDINGKRERGAWCEYCETSARFAADPENPSGLDIMPHREFEAMQDVAERADDESHLRSMDEFAAYQYAGCPQEYLADRDAGFAE